MQWVGNGRTPPSIPNHLSYQVYVAMLIILLLAGAITGLKMYLVEQFGPTPDPKYAANHTQIADLISD